MIKEFFSKIKNYFLGSSKKIISEGYLKGPLNFLYARIYENFSEFEIKDRDKFNLFIAEEKKKPSQIEKSLFNLTSPPDNLSYWKSLDESFSRFYNSVYPNLNSIDSSFEKLIKTLNPNKIKVSWKNPDFSSWRFEY
jgi:hypothetical protein